MPINPVMATPISPPIDSTSSRQRNTVVSHGQEHPVHLTWRIPELCAFYGCGWCLLDICFSQQHMSQLKGRKDRTLQQINQL